MPSIKDVAKLAGVSISTVSNALRGTKFVSAELKERIDRAVSQLGYEANPIARSLKSGSTMTIGVVVTNIHRIFFPQVIRGVQECCRHSGYNLIFYDSADQFELEQRYVRRLEQSWADGIILDSVADEKDLPYFSMLSALENRGSRLPVASLERRLDKHGIDSVGVDNRQGGRLATRHLVKQGCRRIVFVSGPMNSAMVRDRLQGYHDELAKAGVSHEPELVVEGDFSTQGGYGALKTLLAHGVEFDGIFAANDQMAIGVLKALEEHAIDVPGDAKVVGFDDTFVASIVTPALTTIHVPKYELGYEVAQLLLDRLREPDVPPRFVELPLSLIVRQSTDPRGARNWDLQEW